MARLLCRSAPRKARVGSKKGMFMTDRPFNVLFLCTDNSRSWPMILNNTGARKFPALRLPRREVALALKECRSHAAATRWSTHRLRFTPGTRGRSQTNPGSGASRSRHRKYDPRSEGAAQAGGSLRAAWCSRVAFFEARAALVPDFLANLLFRKAAHWPAIIPSAAAFPGSSSIGRYTAGPFARKGSKRSWLGTRIAEPTLAAITAD